MTNPTLWNQLLIWPILNLLVLFYKFFEFFHIPGPLGFAIVMLTITIRLLLYPLMAKQLSSAKKMADLKPHLDALNVKHKDDKKALQQAQMDLYKQHGINPAAGCLPLLVQMPVLIALYNVFYQVLSSGDLAKVTHTINSVVYSSALHLGRLDPTFLGINLGIKPGQWQIHGIWLLTIPVITAGLQWYQTKLMQPAISNTADKTSGTNLSNGKTKDGKDEKPPEDTAAEMQKQMGIIMPLMFGYFALQFPLGLALYWNIFSVMGILQQLQINRQKAANSKQISNKQ